MKVRTYFETGPLGLPHETNCKDRVLYKKYICVNKEVV
jgi:hypothetical protein